MAQPINCTTLSHDGAGGSLDALMVLVSVIMGLLAGFLLVLGFLGRLSGAATTHPTVRFFLWVVFALFLPVTSYMFSVARLSGEVLRSQLILLWMLLAELLRKKLEGVSTINEYPLQGVNKQSTWDAIDQIVRIAWIGFLIYRYEVKWVLVALWAFGVVKVVRRVAALEVAKRSFALGENPHLIAGYMLQLFTEQQQETAATGGDEQQQETAATGSGEEQQQETAATGSGEEQQQETAATGSGEEQQQQQETVATGGGEEQQQQQQEIVATGGGEEQQQQQERVATGGQAGNATWRGMTACKYVIMGEDRVGREAGHRGYSLQPSDDKGKKKMVTVGDVWELDEEVDKLFSSQWLKLKDLCLSFALYKLLRRRFEEYPSAEADRPQSLQFLQSGLLGDDARLPKEDDGERVFRVIEDELSFLGDYYYSTIPLMLSDHWFFLLDCVLVFVIPLFCSIVIIVSIFVVRHGGLIRCLFHQLINRKVAPAPMLYDAIITLLLIATLFLLELAEVVFYVLSDWITVSLLCAYAKKRPWRGSMKVLLGLGALTALRMVKTYWKRASFRFNQHSVLEPRSCTLPIFSQLVLRWRLLRVESALLQNVLHRRYLGVRSTLVPKEVKAAIVKYLVHSKGRGPVLPIGESVLRRNRAEGEERLQARKSDGAAETIIVWHIATCLYEMKHPSSPPSQQQQRQQQQPQQQQQQPQQQQQQQQPQKQPDDHGMQANRRIAETLSKYCAYLVALAPELLPDDTAGTTTAYKAAVKKIQNAILNGHDGDADDFKRVTSMMKANGTAAERGAMLGHQLVEGVWEVERPVGDEQLVRYELLEEWQVWKVLAELWTEIVVYIAPSDDVKSHAQALAHGGEFITHIWALLTHGGILRWPAANENAPAAAPPPAAAAAPPPPAADDQSPV